MACSMVALAGGATAVTTVAISTSSVARSSISCCCRAKPAAPLALTTRSSFYGRVLTSSNAVGGSRCVVARPRVVIRGMAEKVAAPVKKKEDSAKKRARIAEERRKYNKSRKTQIKSRMKKVFVALDSLKKAGAEGPEAIKPIEVLIAEAYSIIDKSVKVGTLHRNTGGNRKSRLARAKRAVEIQLGWYTPAPAS